jgi:NADH-quinone oxidoreductase subunit J
MERCLVTIGEHLFLVFGIMTLIGAAAMVFSKSAVHSVIGFLFTMLSIAACFLCLEAEFLALAQILVYAGGIVVLFLFVVMLVELSNYQEQMMIRFRSLRPLILVAVLAVAFCSVFWATVFGNNAPQALSLKPELAQNLNVSTHNAQAISRGLYANYLLPFEILSVILLMALVGAVTLAKPERV